MKSWNRFQAPLLGALAALVLSGCGEDGFFGEMLPSPDSPPRPTARELAKHDALPPPTLPVRWTLTDVEGRRLDATIIGRGSSSITLVRDQDGKRFELPVARLSNADRSRVATLPVRAAPETSPAESSLYRMRRAKLDEVQARIAEVNRLIERTSSTIQWRSYNSELRRLHQEAGKLSEELRKLEAR